MKSNLLRIFFEWALIASVLMSIGFFFWYFMRSNSARAYETQNANAQAHLQSDRNFLVALGNDCQAYARTNTEMQKFLASLNQQAPAQTAPAKPATR